MPIHHFLEGELFEQEVIEAMNQALADACTSLGLKDKNDAVVRLLAMRIIAEAKQGIHDRALLEGAALRGLGPALKHEAASVGGLFGSASSGSDHPSASRRRSPGS